MKEIIKKTATIAAAALALPLFALQPHEKVAKVPSVGFDRSLQRVSPKRYSETIQSRWFVLIRRFGGRASGCGAADAGRAVEKRARWQTMTWEVCG